jgi:hypothetical protein
MPLRIRKLLIVRMPQKPRRPTISDYLYDFCTMHYSIYLRARRSVKPKKKIPYTSPLNNRNASRGVVPGVLPGRGRTLLCSGGVIALEIGGSDRSVPTTPLTKRKLLILHMAKRLKMPGTPTRSYDFCAVRSSSPLQPRYHFQNTTNHIRNASATCRESGPVRAIS